MSLFLLSSSLTPPRSSLIQLLVSDYPLRRLQFQSTAMLWGLVWSKYPTLLPDDESWRFDRTSNDRTYYNQLLKTVTKVYSSNDVLNDSLGYLEFALISALQTWSRKKTIQNQKDLFISALGDDPRSRMNMNPRLFQELQKA